MSSARDAILARIRKATGPLRGSHPFADAPAVEGAAQTDAPALLAQRLADYGVTVHRATAADLPALVRDLVAARQGGPIVVPAALPEAWRPPGALLDDDLPTATLDNAAGVVTACTVASAANGAIMLNAGPDQGRRALTLLPDYHLCIVREEQVVMSVAEAMARLLPEPGHHAPITIFAGPSATSDIELNRVAGVHGPRRLEVIIVQDA